MTLAGLRAGATLTDPSLCLVPPGVDPGLGRPCRPCPVPRPPGRPSLGLTPSLSEGVTLLLSSGVTLPAPSLGPSSIGATLTGGDPAMPLLPCRPCPWAPG